MAQSAPHEGDSAIIVSLSEAAMHMSTAAIDALPFVEDKKFHNRVDGGRSGMPMSGGRYDALMAHAATAPGSGLGHQLYVTRINAKLSAHEVANGAGLSAELLDAFEAGASPNDEEAARIKDVIGALGGVPGIEPYEHHEPKPEEHEDAHVNGWDQSLVAEHAG